MKKRSRGKYSYTVSLAVSLAVAAMVWGPDYYLKGIQGAVSDFEHFIQSVWAESKSEEAEAPGKDGMAGKESGVVLKETEQSEHVMPKAEKEDMKESEEAEPVADAEEEEEEIPEMYEADVSYFDDALFIGDSRTVGLLEYGNLGGAEVVADSGMNVYKIFQKEFVTVSGEKKRLETVLTERQFGKIYLMLGINELGYDFEHTISKYQDLIGKIREWQPEALIFLEANLHITERKSASSPVYNNDNINRFNAAVAEMADERTIFYLDANELFDDEGGGLGEIYTSDDTHILARYYPDWAAWILRHARTVPGKETNQESETGMEPEAGDAATETGSE